MEPPGTYVNTLRRSGKQLEVRSGKQLEVLLRKVKSLIEFRNFLLTVRDKSNSVTGLIEKKTVNR